MCNTERGTVEGRQTALDLIPECVSPRTRTVRIPRTRQASALSIPPFASVYISPLPVFVYSCSGGVGLVVHAGARGFWERLEFRGFIAVTVPGGWAGSLRITGAGVMSLDTRRERTHRRGLMVHARLLYI